MDMLGAVSLMSWLKGGGKGVRGEKTKMEYESKIVWDDIFLEGEKGKMEGSKEREGMVGVWLVREKGPHEWI